MKNIIRDEEIDLMRSDTKLLYDIRELLKELIFYVKSQEENKDVPSGVHCQYCNGTHDNRFQVAACAKKKKKDGVKNECKY
ncbi:MAG: hypothetical protein N3I35_06720 [Clostridia bacterium]|nr:hypothetical protein [Clostridia bacterium]